MARLAKKDRNILIDGPKLITWYQKHKRPLPWRNTLDPYRIWVSEVMLQQTTVNTVIPYYKKFIKKFSDIKALAKAPLKEVVPYWSGLGYYTRVKNLHKSARIIHKNKCFPRTYKALLKLPGFGPYTSRAVSALAFGEKTTVLDANVIRVMARYTGFKQAWWNQEGRAYLQKSADKWALCHNPVFINQALMEVGALICRPQKPLCFLCPLHSHCQAHQQDQTGSIPLKRQKKKQEIWYYQPVVCIKNNKVALTQQHHLPVLKSYLWFPGQAVKREVRPRHYHFTHLVTHHVIYVLPSLAQEGSRKGVAEEVVPTSQVHKKVENSSKTCIDSKLLWVKVKDIKKQNPSSLIQKILNHILIAK